MNIFAVHSIGLIMQNFRSGRLAQKRGNPKNRYCENVPGYVC